MVSCFVPQKTQFSPGIDTYPLVHVDDFMAKLGRETGRGKAGRSEGGRKRRNEREKQRGGGARSQIHTTGINPEQTDFIKEKG